jgi:P4 family phage/plasmid primase-like protien
MVEPYDTGSSGNNPHVIELELDSKLKQAQIVERLVFNVTTSSVILSLNHAYDRKTVICPINTKQWIRTGNNFSKQLLSNKGISKEHTSQLCDVLDLNYNRIRKFEEDNKNSKADDSLESDEEEEERIENVLMDMYDFRTMNDTKDIYYYDEARGLYAPAGEIIIETQAEAMNDKVSTAIVNEAMNHIRRRTYTSRAEFDTNQPHVINLKNGLLNMDTLELAEHSADQLHLVQLPVKYDANARCPNITRFLREVLSREDVITALEIIGYSLYKTAKYEKAVMLVGLGSNGKSVFLKIIEALIGLQNTSHVSLQDLDKDRFASAGLYCKLVNSFADLKRIKLLSSGNFKMLVSGDSIRAQNKHQRAFDFNNYAKLIFSANEIPESEDTGFAYYRRWLILEFEKIFDDETKDVNLIDKLTTPEELSGLLNLAIIALKRVIARRGWSNIPVDEIKRKYESRSNTVETFINTKCLTDKSFKISVTDLYKAYCKFCDERHQRPVDSTVLGKKLSESGIDKQRLQRQGQKINYYLGIKLSYTDNDHDDEDNNKKTEQQQQQQQQQIDLAQSQLQVEEPKPRPSQSQSQEPEDDQQLWFRQWAQPLGKYGTWRCRHCDYKDDKSAMIRHLKNYHRGQS